MIKVKGQIRETDILAKETHPMLLLSHILKSTSLINFFIHACKKGGDKNETGQNVIYLLMSHPTSNPDPTQISFPRSQ